MFSLSRVAGLAAMLLAGFVAGAASHVGGLRAPLAMHQPPRLVAPAPQTIGLVVKDSRPSPSSAAPIAPMSSAVTPGIVRHVSAHAVASASLPKRVRGYAVTVGAFATAHAATREMHVIRSKGYVVNVVRRGGVAQVVTPPYPTLAQAERVLKGLQEVGAGGRITLM